ncbi:MAG: hypothetical protein IJ744_06000 [Lachnospiraceae bacterium]|nr:hypothetical protein [Lachnospiraceae bacterium]
MGYSTVRAELTTKDVLNSTLQSKKVVHVLTHGAAGVTSCSDGLLYATNIGSVPSLKFAFFETCHSALSPSGGKSTVKTIKDNGASASLGFQGTISASSSSNGCHYYVVCFYGNAMEGKTVYISAVNALNELYAYSGGYYGCNSYMVYGTSTTIN